MKLTIYLSLLLSLGLLTLPSYSSEKQDKGGFVKNEQEKPKKEVTESKPQSQTNSKKDKFPKEEDSENEKLKTTENKSQKHFTEKYFDSFIYSSFWMDETESYFFYLKEVNNKKHLFFLKMKDSLDLENGEKISDIDFNKRSFKTLRFDVKKKALLFLSDTENKEDFNIFKLSLETKKVENLTNSKYVGIYSFSKKGKLIYGDRIDTQNGIFTTTIKLREHYDESLEKEITTDKDDVYRFSWSRPVFSEDEKSVLISIDKENKRQKDNILHINIESGRKIKVLPEESESKSIQPLDIEFSDKGFLYISDISGFQNVYYHDFIENKQKRLTQIESKNNGISIFKKNEEEVFIVIALPEVLKNKTTLHFYKLSSSKDSFTDSFKIDFKDSMFLFQNASKKLWTSQNNLSFPGSLIKYNLENKSLKLDKEIFYYKNLKQDLVHTTHEYLTYKSFDGLEIPAFLVLPKNKEIKGAVIKAFYGGYNYYNSQMQMFAELGIATLSPAVRGSWIFGKEWENYIQGDLGGNEILDLVWAARFLEKKLGLSSQKIGLEGGSHGGYSVLRALTIPDNFNSQKSQYPFGFGISSAGFADLVDLYHTSNIPDFLVYLLGSYEDNKEKYIDRSPLTHFQNLNSPVFIIHGSHDNRVPLSSMEGFLERLKNSDKEHVIYLLEGQGHTGGSKDEKVKQYKKMFEFLEPILGLEK